MHLGAWEQTGSHNPRPTLRKGDGREVGRTRRKTLMLLLPSPFPEAPPAAAAAAITTDGLACHSIKGGRGG